MQIFALSRKSWVLLEQLFSLAIFTRRRPIKAHKIRAHYGYADGSGDYYITIDTDKCDGCGECVSVCPHGVFEIILDDYDESVAAVKQEHATSIGYVCPGYHKRCINEEINCHAKCHVGAIEHSW